MNNLNEQTNRMKSLMEYSLSDLDPYAGKEYNSSTDQWEDKSNKVSEEIPLEVLSYIEKNPHIIGDKLLEITGPEYMYELAERGFGSNEKEDSVEEYPFGDD